MKELSLSIDNGNKIWMMTEHPKEKDKKVITELGLTMLKVEITQFLKKSKQTLPIKNSILLYSKRWMLKLKQEKH